MKPFKTCIIDPAWPYDKSSKPTAQNGLTGYSTDHEYAAMTIKDLTDLPIGELADYVFLWTTGPFIRQAYDLLKAWGFEDKTFLAWVKTQSIEASAEAPFKDGRALDAHGKFKPAYGVGYWFRGCVEPILVAKAPGVKSVKTAWVGLLSPNAEHSRKPDTLYELIEGRPEYGPGFPGPYLEIFGRRERPGWTVIGNEAPATMGEDVRISIHKLLMGVREAA